jgi:hypothetical protein
VMASVNITAVDAATVVKSCFIFLFLFLFLFLFCVSVPIAQRGRRKDLIAVSRWGRTLDRNVDQ